MPKASIDIGSNTVRLLIARIEECRAVPLRYGQSITRLARGLNSSKRLGNQAMDDTIEVLRSFKDIASRYAISQITAAGTGALREAENAIEFIKLIREHTGITVDVLPGHLEAELTALGVTRSLPDVNDALVLDIGGASTEVAVIRDEELQLRQTVPVGVVKLLERHISSDPPTSNEIKSLWAESDIVGRAFSQDLKKLVDHKTRFISTAGTPTSLAAMDLGLKKYDHGRVHGHRISIGRLEEMFSKLAAVSVIERVKMGCIEPKRADLIIPGLSLTIGIMKAFGFHEMTVSDQGLLEGLLLQAAGCGH